MVANPIKSWEKTESIRQWYNLGVNVLIARYGGYVVSGLSNLYIYLEPVSHIHKS